MSKSNLAIFLCHIRDLNRSYHASKTIHVLRSSNQVIPCLSNHLVCHLEKQFYHYLFSRKTWITGTYLLVGFTGELKLIITVFKINNCTQVTHRLSDDKGLNYFNDLSKMWHLHHAQWRYHLCLPQKKISMWPC